MRAKMKTATLAMSTLVPKRQSPKRIIAVEISTMTMSAMISARLSFMTSTRAKRLPIEARSEWSSIAYDRSYCALYFLIASRMPRA